MGIFKDVLFKKIRQKNNLNLPEKTIVITSSDINISTNEFINDFLSTLVENNKKVLLIDADLRSNHFNNAVYNKNDYGIVEVLLGEKTLEECIIEDKIHILKNSYTSEDPTTIVGTTMMKDLISKAKENYDFVIINTPAISNYSDAWVISNFVDKTILIEGENEQSLRIAEERLNMIGSKVLRRKPISLREEKAIYNSGSYDISIA